MRKVIRYALTVAVAVLALLGFVAVPSGAADPAPAVAAGSGSPSAQQVCGGPGNGRMQCMAYRRTDVSHPRGVQRALAAPAGYGPADLASAYNLPTASGGAGETVAITVAFDNPYLESDLAVYRDQFGLPACTSANGCFRKLDQRGGTSYPLPDPHWGGEASLDVDMVSAICPQCRIVVVEADDNSDANLFAAVDTAVGTGAQFVSNSWGGPADPATARQLDAHFQHPGVAFTVSSGDNGYELEYPAFSQYVTAVGGTSLQRSSDARGWTESAWSGAGSGCTNQEPKPSFQHDPLCPNRMEADVAAVANPYTGVAVYDNGWQVYGGTSVSAPIIAGVYALAGSPSADQPANSYPYAHPGDLNDVTTGGNGYCPGVDYFCTAGPGYDGPTGLGTPNGLGAFSAGPHGQVTGTVRDAGTNTAIAGAAVTLDGARTVTDDQGHYALSAPLGGYTLTATKFGYQSASSAVDITADGQHISLDLALTPLPASTLTGHLVDGSGHGWPLYGSVQIDGQPSTKVYTDPATGAYQMSLPNGEYTIVAQPAYPGYQTLRRTVTVSGDQSLDLPATVDDAACDAPGYGVHIQPALAEHFDNGSLPTGWTVNDWAPPMTWAFDDPTGLGNQTGGAGGFASVDGSTVPPGYHGSSLMTPSLDLSTMKHPVLTVRHAHHAGYGSSAQIFADVPGNSYSLFYSGANENGPLSLDLSAVAGQPNVRLEFQFVDFSGDSWEIDDVVVGDRACVPVSGGLVAGHVTDENTAAPVPKARVSAAGADTAVLRTPGDPAQDGSLYALFVPAGTQSISASAPDGYQAVTKPVSVTADQLTTVDFALPAGRLVATPASLAGTVALGSSTTTTFTVTNAGTAPVALTLHASAADSAPASGAPRITGAHVSPVLSRAAYRASLHAHAARSQPDAITPMSPPWTASADTPAAVADDAAATAPDGTVYAVGGVSPGVGLLGSAWRLDPLAATWSTLPDMPHARYEPRAAFLLGKLYVIGGLDENGLPIAAVDVYDPATRTWSSGPTMPHPVSSPGIAGLNGQIYVVGGCTDSAGCGLTDVQVLDPIAGRWSAAPDYPVATSWLGCGGIGTTLYCAGGGNTDTTLASGYRFDPPTNAWTPIADLPAPLWGASVAAQGGRLLVSGGVLDGMITNAGFGYDPATNTWTSLPNANEASYAAAGACGLYRIGGRPDPSDISSTVEVLPGYGGCSGNGAPAWLSASPGQATLQPGASVTVTVTLNAAAAGVSQPGAYQAGLTGAEDTPYPALDVPVTMTVTPPSTWAEVTGTVTGKACSGTVTPLAGATVSVVGSGTQRTTSTDASGHYDVWLPAAGKSVTVYAALDGWTPLSKTARIASGRTTTLDLQLKPDHTCG